jgi:Mrp family chromosome partitioning ATPase
MAAELRREFAHAAAALAREAEAAHPLAVTVTAAAAGEGVTTSTAHLAVGLSGMLGLRVLLLDLGGALGHALARLGHPAPVLADDAVAGSDAPLALVAVGSGDALPALRARLDALLGAAATARFDVVLVDAPPPGDDLAGLLAARCCGRALVVIRAGHLPAAAVERLQQDLAEAGVGMLGAILNQRREVVPRWIERLLR